MRVFLVNLGGDGDGHTLEDDEERLLRGCADGHYPSQDGAYDTRVSSLEAVLTFDPERDPDPFHTIPENNEPLFDDEYFPRNSVFHLKLSLAYARNAPHWLFAILAHRDEDEQQDDRIHETHQEEELPNNTLLAENGCYRVVEKGWAAFLDPSDIDMNAGGRSEDPFSFSFNLVGEGRDEAVEEQDPTKVLVCGFPLCFWRVLFDGVGGKHVTDLDGRRTSIAAATGVARLADRDTTNSWCNTYRGATAFVYFGLWENLCDQAADLIDFRGERDDLKASLLHALLSLGRRASAVARPDLSLPREQSGIEEYNRAVRRMQAVVADLEGRLRPRGAVGAEFRDTQKVLVAAFVRWWPATTFTGPQVKRQQNLFSYIPPGFWRCSYADMDLETMTRQQKFQTVNNEAETPSPPVLGPMEEEAAPGDGDGRGARAPSLAALPPQHSFCTTASEGSFLCGTADSTLMLASKVYGFVGCVPALANRAGSCLAYRAGSFLRQTEGQGPCLVEIETSARTMPGISIVLQMLSARCCNYKQGSSEQRLPGDFLIPAEVLNYVKLHQLHFATSERKDWLDPAARFRVKHPQWKAARENLSVRALSPRAFARYLHSSDPLSHVLWSFWRGATSTSIKYSPGNQYLQVLFRWVLRVRRRDIDVCCLDSRPLSNAHESRCQSLLQLCHAGHWVRAATDVVDIVLERIANLRSERGQSASSATVADDPNSTSGEGGRLFAGVDDQSVALRDFITANRVLDSLCYDFGSEDDGSVAVETTWDQWKWRDVVKRLTLQTDPNSEGQILKRLLQKIRKIRRELGQDEVTGEMQVPPGIGIGGCSTGAAAVGGQGARSACRIS